MSRCQVGLRRSDGDAFVVEHGDEFEVAAHALNDVAPCRQQVVVRCFHGRDRSLGAFEALGKLDLGEVTVPPQFGEVERNGVGASLFFDHL